MLLKVSFINLMISYFLANGDIYVRDSHSHSSHESSSDSSEAGDDNELMPKLKAIETKLTELKIILEGQNSSAVPQPACQNEWIRYHSSCYYFGKRDVEFQEAQLICEGYQANLVNIDSETEYVFIKKQLQDRKGAKYWIGLTDTDVEGDWRQYPSKTPATFIVWGTGEPNQGTTANCGAIWETKAYTFVDEPCTNRNFRPICEMKKVGP